MGCFLYTFFFDVPLHTASENFGLVRRFIYEIRQHSELLHFALTDFVIVAEQMSDHSLMSQYLVTGADIKQNSNGAIQLPLKPIQKTIRGNMVAIKKGLLLHNTHISSQFQIGYVIVSMK